HAFYTHAGPEIGVASTKAFTTQLVSIALVAIHLGRRTGALSRERARVLLGELVQLPQKMRDVVESGAQLQVLARRYGQAHGFLFLGRSSQYPIALEGALKLKEISYIHAEGYSAGEMKHGPIALLDSTVPVVGVVTEDRVREKMLSNLMESKAREAPVVAVANYGDEEVRNVADHVFWVPRVDELLSPIVNVIPLQLLAYHIADIEGKDVDQPRNLAKTVTVE
ncbi:MAG TPA: SIS domain-containing protein, partial [Candidatus Cybelea sp.]